MSSAQLERAGGVDRREMFRTFNMGVGMVVIAAESGRADHAIRPRGRTGVQRLAAGA